MFKKFTFAFALCVFGLTVNGQVTDTLSAPKPDTLKKETTFSGTLSLSTNGFSIVPVLSMNAPAIISILSWQRGKFSISPDVRLRLSPTATKGGMLLWFRYHAIEKKKFSLRLGVHPAMALVERDINNNGQVTTLTQALRFAAFEVAPAYQINPHWNVGLYYLQGYGLQSYGPQRSNFMSLHTAITNLKIGGKFRFHFIPSAYYLILDGGRGSYFTATAALAHQKWPFTVSSSINQVIKTDISGGQDFMWNVALNYNMFRKYKKA